MDKVNDAIWKKFHIHHGDNLPFTPWLENANRNHLAELFGELGYKKGAEIGVRMGRFTKVIFDANPGVEIICVDPWAPYNRVSQEKQDKFFAYCKARLEPYNVKYMRMPSLEAVKSIEDESLDFIFLDGLHDFRSVIMDLLQWCPKVKKGGIISGHDFYSHYQGGVVIAVEAYVKAHNIQMWYVTKELQPSWFWVKN